MSNKAIPVTIMAWDSEDRNATLVPKPGAINPDTYKYVVGITVTRDIPIVGESNTTDVTQITFDGDPNVWVQEPVEEVIRRINGGEVPKPETESFGDSNEVALPA